jgi:hypothetical protein
VALDRAGAEAIQDRVRHRILQTFAWRVIPDENERKEMVQ